MSKTVIWMLAAIGAFVGVLVFGILAIKAHENDQSAYFMGLFFSVALAGYSLRQGGSVYEKGKYKKIAQLLEADQPVLHWEYEQQRWRTFVVPYWSAKTAQLTKIFAGLLGVFLATMFLIAALKEQVNSSKLLLVTTVLTTLIVGLWWISNEYTVSTRNAYLTSYSPEVHFSRGGIIVNQKHLISFAGVHQSIERVEAAEEHGTECVKIHIQTHSGDSKSVQKVLFPIPVGKEHAVQELRELLMKKSPVS